MRCTACHGQVAFERSVFLGTKPTTVRLCATCAERVDVTTHMDAINTAPDHEAKNAAVGAFLEAVQACEAEKSPPGD